MKIVITVTVFAVSSYSFAQWENITQNLPGTYLTVSGGVNDFCNDSTIVCKFFLTENSEDVWKTFISTDFGSSWKELPQQEGMGISGIAMIDTLNLWVIDSHLRICKTSDGGQTWQEQFSDTAITKFINCIEMFDDQHGIAMGDGRGEDPVILSTINGGQNWDVHISNQQIGPQVIWGSEQVDFIDNNTGYLSPDKLDYRIYKTVDGGLTWTKTGFVPVTSGSVHQLKFGNEKIGFMSDNGSFYRTIDGGATWSKYGYYEAFTRWAIKFVPGQTASVWLVGDNELFYSNDTGATWQTVTISGFGMSHGNEGRDLIVTSEMNGMLFTRSGIYRNMQGPSATAVRETMVIQQPDGFELHQNFPNPFNPETDIVYTLSRPEYVSLDIFDLLGRHIASLVDRHEETGTHHVRWTAGDKFGNSLQSGVYIYQMRIGNGIQQRKMILLK